MTIHTYELQRGRALAAREEARYLRDLHKTATCGLPMELHHFHYGTREVRPSVAARVADSYLQWAAEWDELAERIEADMAAMLRADEREQSNGQSS